MPANELLDNDPDFDYYWSGQESLDELSYSIVVQHMDPETLYTLSRTSRAMRNYVKFHPLLNFDLIKIPHAIAFIREAECGSKWLKELSNIDDQHHERIRKYRKFIINVSKKIYNEPSTIFGGKIDALSKAASYGLYYLIEDLLEHSKNDEHNLAVHTAAWCHKQENGIKVLDILYDHGADFNKVSPTGITARYCAAQENNRKTYDYLMRRHEAQFIREISTVLPQCNDDKPLSKTDIQDLKLCLDFILDYKSTEPSSLKRDSYEDTKFIYSSVAHDVEANTSSFHDRINLVEKLEHHRCLLYKNDSRYMSIPGSSLKNKIFEDVLAVLKMLFINKTLAPERFCNENQDFSQRHLSVFNQDEMLCIQFIGLFIQHKVNIGVVFCGEMLSFYLMLRMHQKNQVAAYVENQMYDHFKHTVLGYHAKKSNQHQDLTKKKHLIQNISIVNAFFENYMSKHPLDSGDLHHPLIMKLRFYEKYSIESTDHDLSGLMQQDYDAIIKHINSLRLNAWQRIDTVMHAAIRMYDQRMAELLVKNKMLVNTVNKQESTPLMLLYSMNYSIFYEPYTLKNADFDINSLIKTLESNAGKITSFDTCLEIHINSIVDLSRRETSLNRFVSSRPYYQYLVSRKKILLPTLATGIAVGLGLRQVTSHVFSGLCVNHTNAVMLFAIGSAAFTFILFASLLRFHHLNQVAAACDKDNPPKQYLVFV